MQILSHLDLSIHTNSTLSRCLQPPNVFEENETLNNTLFPVSFFLLSLILLKQPLTTYGQIAIVDIAVEAKVRTLPNAEILSEITSDFLLTRSAILRLL